MRQKSVAISAAVNLKDPHRKSKGGIILLAALCALYWPQGLSLAKNKKNELTSAALDKVMEASNIKAEGRPAFRMKAKVRLFQDNGRFVEGSYLLIWASPNQSREEVVFPDYSETTVTSPAKTWSVKSQDYRPYPVARLLHSLEVGSNWRQARKNPINKEVEMEEDGIKMDCAIMQPPMGTSSQLCANSLTRNLVSESLTNSDSIAEYRRFESWGDKEFPRLILTYRGKELVSTVGVEELTADPNPDPSLFSLPIGTQTHSQPYCEAKDIKPARIIKSVAPTYPQHARDNGIAGNVALYSVVGIDGIPHMLQVMHSAGPELDEAALKIVNKWKFQPASCGGVPVEVESPIIVHFQLGE